VLTFSILLNRMNHTWSLMGIPTIHVSVERL